MIISYTEIVPLKFSVYCDHDFNVLIPLMSDTDRANFCLRGTELKNALNIDWL